MARIASRKAAAKPPARTKPAPAAVKAAPKPSAAPAAPKYSKDELRAQVAKLEASNATLRAKSRVANKAAKAASQRIAELEEQVAQLEQAAAAKPAPRRAGRKGREIDPGDGVPPGVAVLEPEPLDAEAEQALGNLEEHLHEP